MLSNLHFKKNKNLRVYEITFELQLQFFVSGIYNM